MLYFRPLKRVLCLATVLIGGAAQAGSLSVDPETFDYLALPATGLVRVAITDVISLLSPPTDPARSRVFYPSLALLSANYLVVRASEGSSWRFDLPEYAQTISPGYRLTVEVDRSGPERFMVVYTAHDADSSTLMGAADAGQLLIKVTRQAEE